MEQGLILGRYRPLADIGEGGHGSVTLAFDTRMARRVAIKRIPLSHAGVRRLASTTGLAEARTAALLNHPDIVTVHEWDTDSDEAFLIMEHVDGVSLAGLLDEYAPLDVDEAAAVLEPVCSALEYAHANGVLHLDLKPDNVLITRDGLVKVADFGVASLTNAAGQAISAGGTLGYMPPEQLRGDVVDVRTDVWALGVLAYETLTGVVPLAADTIEGAISRAEGDLPSPPTDYAEALPPEVDEPLLAAMAPAPDERHPSVREFADSLLPMLGDPANGRDGLRDLVGAMLEEETPEEREPGALAVGLWDRLVPYEPVLVRIAAALSCGWLAWTGLVPWTHVIGAPAVLGATALVAAAGAIAPPLGLAVGFGAALLATRGLAAVAAVVFVIAWWLLVVRRSAWAGLVPALSPLLSAIGLGPAAPLLAGFFLPSPGLAAAAGGGAGLLAVWSGVWPAASVPFLTSVVDTGPFFGPPVAVAPLRWWIALAATTAGWAAVAAIMSAACRRASRGGAVAGAVVSLLVLTVVAGPWVTGTQQVVVGVAAGVVLSLILVGVVVALGPPVASEPDD